MPSRAAPVPVGLPPVAVHDGSWDQRLAVALAFLDPFVLGEHVLRDVDDDDRVTLPPSFTSSGESESQTPDHSRFVRCVPVLSQPVPEDGVRLVCSVVRLHDRPPFRRASIRSARSPSSSP